MRNKPLFILDEDKHAARKRIAELEQEIQDLGPEFHIVFNQSSETWHDNAPFDALRERQAVLFAELQYLKGILSNAAIKIPKPKKHLVDIGARVTVEYRYDGKEIVYFIAGDWTARAGELHHQAIVVNSKAPIAQALLNKRLHDEVDFRGSLIIKDIEYR